MHSPAASALKNGAGPRAANRRAALLAAAAQCFVERGYGGTSMRDIAAAAGMQAGSIYYHFPSKEHLFLAVYEAGVKTITEAVQSAVTACAEPWQRLEAACATHLTVLLTGGAFSQVIQRELPAESTAMRKRLVALRDEYESIFARLVEEVGLPRDVDGTELRLMLMGAMNYAHTWFRPGAGAPAAIAAKFVRFLRTPMEDTR